MPEGSSSPDRYSVSALLKPRALASLALIGVIVVAVAALFAFAAGLFSPQRITQARVVDLFEQVGGRHPGFRRNHAKGVCATGWFESNGAGEALSAAAVFRPGRTPVIGRFAYAGGMPAMADSPAAVRSLALSFRPPGGGEWRTGMVNIPVFIVPTPHAFYQQLAASAPDPATGKPDPARMQAFLAANPETAQALKLIGAKPFSSGFENTDYNALNAFRFINAQGVSTPVRWSVVAVDPFAPEPAGAASSDPNYMFDALIDRVRTGPVQWRLVVTVGQPGDPTRDATLPWPADRRRVDVGTVTLTQLETEAPGNCRDINYDPLVLPPGIAPSDDPLLSARSAAYSTSFTRRAGEPKSPSAVQVPPTGKGA